MQNAPESLTKLHQHYKALSMDVGSKLPAIANLFQMIPGDPGVEDPGQTPEIPDNNPQQEKSLVPLFLKVLTKNKIFTTQYDENKKVLVLDLDETLLHSYKYYPGSNKSIFVPIKIRESLNLYYVIKRPGVDDFLQEMIKCYNICIYTASEEEYALGIMEATGITKYFYGLYSRRHCLKVSENIYMKNLNNVGFLEDKTVFVDDFPIQMKNQPKNGLIIKRFYQDDEDQELKRLAPFFKYLAKLDNVTPVAKHFFDFFAPENRVKMEKIGAPSVITGSRDSIEIEEMGNSYKLHKTTSLEIPTGKKIMLSSSTFHSFGRAGKNFEIPSTEEDNPSEESMSDSNKSDFFMISKKPVLKKLNPKD